MRISHFSDVRAQRSHRAPLQHGLATIASHDVGAVDARSDLPFLALLAACPHVESDAIPAECSNPLPPRPRPRCHRTERAVCVCSLTPHAYRVQTVDEQQRAKDGKGRAAVFASARISRWRTHTLSVCPRLP